MATLNPGFYDKNLPAFLDTLAFSEGTSSSPITQHDGYDIIVDSIHGHASFTSFDCHPFCIPGQPRPLQVLNHATPPLRSDAAGRYQLMAKYWEPYRQQLKVPDFGPLSQDLIAVQQIKECNALHLVTAGEIPEALAACKHIWASLPGAGYAGQVGCYSTAQLVAFFERRLAAY